MDYFALFYELVDDFVQRRAPYREEHLRLANAAHRRGEIVLAGALAEPADTAMIIFRSDTPATATSFAQNDPYVCHGLVKQWKVRPWTVVVGDKTLSSIRTAQGES